MLAPFFIDMLVGCLLLILAGWVSDEIRAGRRDVESMRPPGWNQMSRPRNLGHLTTPTRHGSARPVRRQF